MEAVSNFSLLTVTVALLLTTPYGFILHRSLLNTHVSAPFRFAWPLCLVQQSWPPYSASGAAVARLSGPSLVSIAFPTAEWTTIPSSARLS